MREHKREPQRISGILSGLLITQVVEPALASKLGIKPEVLREALTIRARPMEPDDPLSPYHRFSGKKRGGGIRWITAPHKTLKEVQRAIHDRILTPSYIETDIAHGFVPGRGIVTNASAHLGLDEERPQLFPAHALSFDLKDAFPSVKAERVLEIFKQIVEPEFVQLLGFLTTWEGSIPQGAPSSPVLLNLALQDLDEKMQKLVEEKYGLVVTRYVDDFTISSEGPIPKALFREVVQLVQKHGFKINPAKTRWQDQRHAALEVTGLKLVNGKVRLPQSAQRRFRAILHQVSRIPEQQFEDEKFAKHALGICVGIVGLVKNVHGQLPRQIAVPFQRLVDMGRMPTLAKLKQRKWREMIQEFEYDYFAY